MAKKITKIVVSDEHFLYLPLYYAQHKKFFGFLPPDCRIDIIRSTRHTDASAFSMLMDEDTPNHQGIDIAVCDPAVILNYSGRIHQPVLLAGLLTNSAFWAVNHKSNRVNFLEDLATFEKLISFKEGSTSFGIASRIFHSPEKAKAIVTVNPKEELNLLADSSPGTLALSPDIVGIQQLLESRGHQFGIELALAETNEYRDMLVTGLLTRRDVLDTKGDVVRAFLKAVQVALLSVRSSADDVIEYARERFGQQRHTIQKALTEAHRVEVYPPNIKVSQPTWMKLAEVSSHSWGRGFDEIARKHALSVYRLMVEPYASWAASAVSEIEKVAITFPENTQKASALRAVADIVVPAVLFAGFTTVYSMIVSVAPWYAYAMLALAVIAAVAAARWAGIAPWTLSGVIFWAPLLVVASAFLALFDIAAVRGFVLDTFMIDVGSSLSTVALGVTIAGLIYAEVQYVESVRDRQK